MKKKNAQLEKDNNGHIIMSPKNLSICCEREQLYATPELNEKLYLHYKGFHKIENLHRFTGLRAIWLNNNAIQKIQNLGYCKQLITLYLNNNIISKIQGLDELAELSILNLSFNRITKIEGLASLQKLNTFNITHNMLTDDESIKGILECPSVANFDMSDNEIEANDSILEVLQGMPELTCLYLRNTPLVRSVKNYRKLFVSSLKKLKFLDERPVMENERRLAEAWAKGGQEMENVEKAKLTKEREAANRKNYEDFEKLAGPPRQRRRKLYEELGKAKIQALQDLKKQKSELQKQKQTEQVINEICQVNEKIDEYTRYLADLEDVVSGATVRQGWKLQDYRLIMTKTGLKLINFEEERQKARIDQEIMQFSEEKKREYEKSRKELQELEALEQQQIETLPMKLIEAEEITEKKNIMKNWDSRFEPLLELLLEKHQFDFDQVYPYFNMAIVDMYKKLGLPIIRFEGKELREIWTIIEKNKRNQLQDLD